MFFNSSGQIDSATHTAIAEVAMNGFESGIQVPLHAKLNQVGALVGLLPNPANKNSNIALNLDKEAVLEVSVSQINGAIVGNKNCGSLSSKLILQIEMNNFKLGMDFVNVKINVTGNLIKLIRE